MGISIGCTESYERCMSTVSAVSTGRPRPTITTSTPITSITRIVWGTQGKPGRVKEVSMVTLIFSVV